MKASADKVNPHHSLRVLTIVHDLDQGGMQRAAQNNAVAYLRQGLESAVLAYRESGPRLANLQRAGVTTFAPEAGETREQLLQRASQWCPDVLDVHGFGQPDPVEASVIRFFKDGKASKDLRVVKTSHFGRPDHSPDRHLIDAHLHISQCCLWMWRRWTSNQRPRPVGVFIPHMVYPETFTTLPEEARDATRRELGLPPGAVLCGRAGQSDPVIWPKSLIEVFSSAAAKDPNLWLLLVGYPPKLVGGLDALPADIRKRIIVHPFVKDDKRLVELYNSMDIFLHITAIGETFGLVLCEAALCGLPVVTLSTPTKGNAQVEVVGHQRGGLVAATTADAVGAVLALAADADLRTRLARQGAKWVREELDPQKIALKRATCLRLVQQHSREELRVRFENDPSWCCDVSSVQIEAMLNNMLGRPTLAQRFIRVLVYNPSIYRLYMWLKRRT